MIDLILFLFFVWQVFWTDRPCKNFHLLICLAILDTEKSTLMENKFGLTEILKVSIFIHILFTSSITLTVGANFFCLLWFWNILHIVQYLFTVQISRYKIGCKCVVHVFGILIYILIYFTLPEAYSIVLIFTFWILCPYSTSMIWAWRYIWRSRWRKPRVYLSS